MITVTFSIATATTANTTRNDYADGYFDAATHAPAKQTTGDYYKGYLAYTKETNEPPF